MEIKDENKFKRIFKRYGVLSLACVFSLAIALTIAFSAKSPTEEVSTQVMKFGLPMQNATVVKDYSEDRLQYNENLNRWEIHLAVDLTSQDSSVCSIYDGVVASVDSNSLDGCIVTINHQDGFVSVYSSLAEDVSVKAGDKVVKGQKIGAASTTASTESVSGGHLHLVMLKDGVEVDPNNYLDLQNK